MPARQRRKLALLSRTAGRPRLIDTRRSARGTRLVITNVYHNPGSLEALRVLGQRPRLHVRIVKALSKKDAPLGHAVHKRDTAPDHDDLPAVRHRDWHALNVVDVCDISTYGASHLEEQTPVHVLSLFRSPLPLLSIFPTLVSIAPKVRLPLLTCSMTNALESWTIGKTSFLGNRLPPEERLT
jgi:hypothetical protein